jgi:hypothetical protein
VVHAGHRRFPFGSSAGRCTSRAHRRHSYSRRCSRVTPPDPWSVRNPGLTTGVRPGSAAPRQQLAQRARSCSSSVPQWRRCGLGPAGRCGASGRVPRREIQRMLSAIGRDARRPSRRARRAGRPTRPGGPGGCPAAARAPAATAPGRRRPRAATG